jgi:hypothetical protein
LYITFSIVGEGEITPPVPGKLYITFSIVGERGDNSTCSWYVLHVHFRCSVQIYDFY